MLENFVNFGRLRKNIKTIIQVYSPFNFRTSFIRPPQQRRGNSGHFQHVKR